MSLADASRKAKFSKDTARRYNRQYIDDNNMGTPIANVGNRFTHDKINGFLRYLFDEEMSIEAASKKANMSSPSGRRYYEKYLENQHLDISPKYITV
jgi:hypothetical protein